MDCASVISPEPIIRLDLLAGDPLAVHVLLFVLALGFSLGQVRSPSRRGHADC